MSDRSSSVCGIMSKTLAVLNGVGLVVATLGALRMRGDFLDIYRDLLSGQSLPVVTQFVLSVPSWTVLLVAMVLLGILAIKELIRPK